MSFSVAAAVYCFLLLSESPQDASAQPQSSTHPARTIQWSRVKSLSSGAYLHIRKVDKTSVKGSFVAAGDDELTIEAKGLQLRIPKSSISKVRARRTSARLKGAGIGAAVGAGAGIAIAAGLGGVLTDGNGISEEAVAILGTLGAVIGFGVGLIPPAYITLYELR